MPFVYSPIDDVQNLYDAGFRVSKGLVIAIAVTCAETANTYDPKISNTAGNTPPSKDRGLREINDYWHPEVSDACAYDPVCSAKEMYRISKQGTDFTPWSSYNNGAYSKYMNWAWVAVDAWTRLGKASAQLTQAVADAVNAQSTADAQKLADAIATKDASIAKLNATVSDLQAQISQMSGADKDLLARLQAAQAAVTAANAARDEIQGQYDALVQRVRDYGDSIVAGILS